MPPRLTFLCECEGLNLGPHTCVTGVLQAELSITPSPLLGSCYYCLRKIGIGTALHCTLHQEKKIDFYFHSCQSVIITLQRKSLVPGVLT